MRILCTLGNEFAIIEVTRVEYDSIKKVAVVYEMGFDGYIEFNIDKRRYEKDLQTLLERGYLDWNDFECEPVEES